MELQKYLGSEIPASKSGIQDVVAALEELVREGEEDPAKIMVAGSVMKSLGDAIGKSDVLKQGVINDFIPLFAAGKEKPTCMGALIVEGGTTKYDYSETHAWNEVSDYIKTLSTFKKQIEDQAKLLLKNGQAVAYITDLDGEEIEVKPAKVDADKSTSGVKITLPK